MKARYFFILAIVFSIISIVALRFNNLKAAAMAKEIANKDNLNVDVAADIERLHDFVFKHMNSSLRFELTASYERAVANAKNAATAGVSGDVYAQAQANCDRQGVSSVAQAQCVQEYLNARIQPGPVQPAVIPSKSQYTYAFASPSWTPDIAGFSLLAALASALATLAAYTYGMFARPDPSKLVDTKINKS